MKLGWSEGRGSVNDRICLPRDMVAREGPGACIRAGAGSQPCENWRRGWRGSEFASGNDSGAICPGSDGRRRFEGRRSAGLSASRLLAVYWAP